jgi:hypothetical protein
MPMQRITLRLARNPGYPDGDASQGYVLTAPIDTQGHLVLDEWRAHKKACTVLRFHPDEDERADGWLTHRGSHWFFHYDEDHEGPDEPVHRLDDHSFVAGEYVTIRHMDEDALTYVVTEVARA